MKEILVGETVWVQDGMGLDVSQDKVVSVDGDLIKTERFSFAHCRVHVAHTKEELAEQTTGCAKCHHYAESHITHGWGHFVAIDPADKHALQLCTEIVVVRPYRESYICQCNYFEPAKYDEAGCALNSYETVYGRRSKSAKSEFTPELVEHSKYWHEKKGFPLDEAAYYKEEDKTAYCLRCRAALDHGGRFRIGRDFDVTVFGGSDLCPKCIVEIIVTGEDLELFNGTDEHPCSQCGAMTKGDRGAYDFCDMDYSVTLHCAVNGMCNSYPVCLSCVKRAILEGEGRPFIETVNVTEIIDERSDGSVIVRAEEQPYKRGHDILANE